MQLNNDAKITDYIYKMVFKKNQDEICFYIN